MSSSSGALSLSSFRLITPSFAVVVPPPPPPLPLAAAAAAAAVPLRLISRGILLRRHVISTTTQKKKKKFHSTICFSALTPELRTTLDKVVTSQKIILFMKGTKDFPQCGFSNTVVQILKSFNMPFETIDVLENEILRQGLKDYSKWPTFPQLYIDGEFFGGCDITVEAYKSGELQELLEKTLCS